MNKKPSILNLIGIRGAVEVTCHLPLNLFLIYIFLWTYRKFENFTSKKNSVYGLTICFENTKSEYKYKIEIRYQ